MLTSSLESKCEDFVLKSIVGVVL